MQGLRLGGVGFGSWNFDNKFGVWGLGLSSVGFRVEGIPDSLP